MPSNIYIHPYHFLTAYPYWRNNLKKVKEYSTPLTKDEAKLITKLDKRNRYCEYTNSMFNLHNSLLDKIEYQRPALQEQKFKHLFIQSPFT